MFNLKKTVAWNIGENWLNSWSKQRHPAARPSLEWGRDEKVIGWHGKFGHSNVVRCLNAGSCSVYVAERDEPGGVVECWSWSALQALSCTLPARTWLRLWSERWWGKGFVTVGHLIAPADQSGSLSCGDRNLGTQPCSPIRLLESRGSCLFLWPLQMFWKLLES